MNAQTPQLPRINPEIYERISGIAHTLDRVPLTRAEFATAAGGLGVVTRYIENLEAQLRQATTPAPATDAPANVVTPELK